MIAVLRRHPRRTLLTVTVALGVPLVGVAHGAVVQPRTLQISTQSGGVPANGSSAEPFLSTTGRVIAFTTTSTGIVPGDELNGPIADVVVLDGVSGERRLVSATPDGTGADGASTDPAMSRDGQRVVFTSDATNLVPGDGNGASDVFVRDGIGRVLPVSVTPSGTLGNRASRNADISADGRYVVFESDASDLVNGDSNGQTDVFVRDLLTGQTERVSVSTDGEQARFRSSTPAISANGRVVSFESAANTLVDEDTNRQADVFVRDLVRRETSRVSVSTNGRQQNRAVTAPFRMVSDLDATGRLVVFDSEASNLVPNDINRRSDVFVRDRREETTRLVSSSSSSVQGNNDSVSPVITPSGRHVAFQSFATNLARDGDGVGADIFVRDLRTFTTTIASVANDGGRRQPELTGQLLQRPTITNDGETVGFVSTATNLVPGVPDALADVFVRRLVPARTSSVDRTSRSVTVGADDPGATRYLCRVDLGVPFTCGPTVSLRRPGRSITIRATGPGILPDPIGRTFRLTLDRIRPRARITSVSTSRSRRTIRGVTTDRGGSGILKVEIAVTYVNSVGRCFFLDGDRFRPTFNCQLRAFRNVAVGKRSWRFKIGPRLPPALLLVAARAVDGSGNVSRVSSKITILP
ncbi:hypothetical protein GKE82_01790 [Conexibacter sp. W3-3-2]|uniref:TolB family protein n=1 Tax=Conexibacter sp. W3-3-2 TaxID=2675227 RepID=UPI0012B96E34|nr:PD40 domain-containing protein [Conexibacter sp. W3-3-2]MTD43068.1 hypothetical protein [Conexibacter sp. W3-3-2]